jgi:HAD superfamily hydrolase (TIGR01549 family)
MLKAVLIDLDNTLYSYPECNNHANEIVLKKISSDYNIPIQATHRDFSHARAEVKKKYHHTAYSHSRMLYFKELLNILGQKEGLDEEALELENLFWNEFFTKMKLDEEALKFLEECKKRHLKVCIVTDLTTTIQHKKIDFFGIRHYFDAILTSEDAGVEKPDPLIFKKALDLVGATPSEAIMVGDEYEKDIVGARNLGITAVHIKDISSWQEAMKIINALSTKSI